MIIIIIIIVIAIGCFWFGKKVRAFFFFSLLFVVRACVFTSWLSTTIARKVKANERASKISSGTREPNASNISSERVFFAPGEPLIRDKEKELRKRVKSEKAAGGAATIRQTDSKEHALYASIWLASPFFAGRKKSKSEQNSNIFKFILVATAASSLTRAV